MKLSIVLPCYKEGRVIERTVGQLFQMISADSYITDCEIILVVEKSTTDTLNVACKLGEGDRRIQVLANDECYGKGYSVRRGVMHSRGDLVLVNDADLPVDVSRYFPLMMNLVLGEQVGAVYLTAFGDKTDFRKRGFLRAEMTYLLFALRRWFLKHTISDTQLGCKLYHGDLVRNLMPMVDEPGFLYELEMTDLIDWSGYRIEECAVRITQFSRESSVTSKTVVANLIAFFKYSLFKRKKLFNRQLFGHLFPAVNTKRGRLMM